MIKRLIKHISGCLRYKLLGLVFVPVLLLMLAVISLAFYWTNGVSYQQLLMKVTSDLSVTHEAFIATQERYLAEIKHLADSNKLHNALQENQQVLKTLLQNHQKKSEFDFIRIIDLGGCEILETSKCGYNQSPLFTKALAGIEYTGVEIFSNQRLNDIKSELAVKVSLPLINTPHSEPLLRLTEDRGMVINSFYPIMGENNKAIAVLTGGVLLNYNFKFVDQLRDLVYSEGSLAENGIGTVTVFLGDVRISTNVPKKTKLPNERALGTRVSKEVREQVLVQGKSWIDRAFVVSEWYISAYEPIQDIYGQHVGMLYTGFLEKPFRSIYFQGLVLLLSLFFAVTALCVVLAILAAKSIFKPIERMAKVIKKFQAGEEVRIGKVDSSDEVSVLANQFDEMLDTLQAQREEIQAAAHSLEMKVETRTMQLQSRTTELQKNVDLLNQTREQLIAKEKFAAIGELAAGIAHEINNPTAVILGYTELLISELGDDADSIKNETDLIIQQVHRIRAIINSLLQYSRPSAYQNASSSVDLNSIVNDTILLVKHDLSQKEIDLHLHLKSTYLVDGNYQQFQQVLINLIVNAIHASDRKGIIKIRSKNWKDTGILLIIRDNGCGISDELLPKIFDPFTSKKKTGTGLGLAISYSILKYYEAEIIVRSKLGVGTRFYIWFPKHPNINRTEPPPLSTELPV